jgi:hypothetical protein
MITTLTAIEIPAIREFFLPGRLSLPPAPKDFAIKRFIFKIFIIFVTSISLLDLKLNYGTPL